MTIESMPQSIKDLTSAQVDILNDCVRKPYKRHKIGLDAVSGMRFGKLLVLEDAPRKGSRKYWLCRCDCGHEHTGQAYQIRAGLIKSCGNCKRVSGASQTPEYNAWRDAVARCCKSNHPAWLSYGARGITVCPEWVSDFAAFLAYVGKRPAPHLTLERIDNERGYEPGNVKWATRKEQVANTRPAIARKELAYLSVNWVI